MWEAMAMAGACPCGCGRKVPFGRGGAATGYRRMRENLGQLDQIAAEVRQSGVDPTALLALSPEGREIAALVLDHVHKTASPTTHPDLLNLSRMMDQWDAKWQRAMATLI